MLFTKENIGTVIAEARQAGIKAAQKQLAKLQANGPVFNVFNADIVTGKTIGGPVGTMLDVCGRADIVLPNGRKGYCKLFKAYSDNHANRTFFCKRYNSPGFQFAIFDMHNRQEISVDEAAHKAALEVLKKYFNLFDAYVTTRID